MNGNDYDYFNEQLINHNNKIKELESKLAESEKASASDYYNWEKKCDALEKQLSEAIEVNELNKALYDEAIEVIQFYHAWTRDDLHCDKICGQATDKRAREFLSKHELNIVKN